MTQEVSMAQFVYSTVCTNSESIMLTPPEKQQTPQISLPDKDQISLPPSDTDSAPSELKSKTIKKRFKPDFRMPVPNALQERNGTERDKRVSFVGGALHLYTIQAKDGKCYSVDPATPLETIWDEVHQVWKGEKGPRSVISCSAIARQCFPEVPQEMYMAKVIRNVLRYITDPVFYQEFVRLNSQSRYPKDISKGYKNAGITVEDLLAQWNAKTKESQEDGTNMHARFELFYNIWVQNKEYAYLFLEKVCDYESKWIKEHQEKYDVEEEGKLPLLLPGIGRRNAKQEIKEFLAYHEDMVVKGPYEPYLTEPVLYLDQFEGKNVFIAGSVDLVLREKKKDNKNKEEMKKKSDTLLLPEERIVDYKRIDCALHKESWHEREKVVRRNPEDGVFDYGYGPFRQTPHERYWEYCIQTNSYAVIRRTAYQSNPTHVELLVCYPGKLYVPCKMENIESQVKELFRIRAKCWERGIHLYDYWKELEPDKCKTQERLRQEDIDFVKETIRQEKEAKGDIHKTPIAQAVIQEWREKQRRYAPKPKAKVDKEEISKWEEGNEGFDIDDEQEDQSNPKTSKDGRSGSSGSKRLAKDFMDKSKTKSKTNSSMLKKLKKERKK